MNLQKLLWSLQEPQTNRIIFAGLFPPADSHPLCQHNNRTSRAIQTKLGSDQFDWIDIWPYLPPEKNKDIDQYKLENYLFQNPSYAINWLTQIQLRVDQLLFYSYEPIIYICGKICTQEWHRQTKNFPIIEIDYSLKLYTIILNNNPVIILEGPHPSAHLYGGEIRINEFRVEMKILQILLAGRHKGIHDIKVYLDEIDQLRLKNSCKLSRWICNTKSWPDKMAHLHYLQYNQQKIVDRVEFLGDEDLSDRLLCNSTFMNRIGNDTFWQLFIHLFSSKTYTQESIILLFKTKAFCVHITDNGFMDMFGKLSKKYSNTNFLELFKTTAFCVHLTNDGFFDTFQKLSKKYGDRNVLELFKTDAFCVHLTDPGFLISLEELHNKYKDNALLLFQTNSFCVRISKPSFRQKLDELIKAIRIENAITLFSTSSFSIQVEQKGFDSDYAKIISDVGFNNAMKLFSTTSFNSNLKLLQPRFDKILNQYGKDITVSLFLCRSFSTYIKDINFWGKCEQLISYLGDNINNALPFLSTTTFVSKFVKLDISKIYETIISPISKLIDFSSMSMLFRCHAFSHRIFFHPFRNFIYHVIQEKTIPLNLLLLFFGNESFCETTSKYNNEYLTDETISINKNKDFTTTEELEISIKLIQKLIECGLECVTVSYYQKWSQDKIASRRLPSLQDLLDSPDASTLKSKLVILPK